MRWRFVRSGGFGLAFLLATVVMDAAGAPTTYFSDRASFTAAVGSTITDPYTGYGATPSTPMVLSDASMSAVLGETRYEAITFPDQNSVGPVYMYGDGSNYCAGCNGNFRLLFDSTSFTSGGGVFGLGVDIVLHTSRMTDLGSAEPGTPSLAGTLTVEFKNGAFQSFAVPADVGVFGPEIFFFGLTDSRGIQALTIGTDTTQHLWVIDNLTIAGHRIPEPGTLAAIAAGLGGLAILRRRQR